VPHPLGEEHAAGSARAGRAKPIMNGQSVAAPTVVIRQRERRLTNPNLIRGPRWYARSPGWRTFCS
jgi:hypothetical protein